MSIERNCPRCGTALAPDALEGLCPRCVGRAVFADDATIAGTVTGIEGARPPDRRLARRNRVIRAATAAVVAALVTGLSVAIHSYFNERMARANEAQQRQMAEEGKWQAQASAREATASELKARRFLYAADINLAQQSLRLNNLGRARQLLDRHRPTNGQLDLRGWEWRYLWQQCRGGAQTMLTKHDGSRAFSVSFSPDGALLAVGFFDGQVELWNLARRKLARIVQAPFDQRAHVAFSPRGDVLAVTMGPRTVKAHNVSTGVSTLLWEVDGFVRDLSFSRDGELLAVLSGEPDMVQVLRVADTKGVMTYPLPKGGGMHFNNARLSPDKQRLYVSCGAFNGPKVRCVTVPDARLLWEIGDGEIEGREEESRADYGFSAMDLSPDGRALAVATGYSSPYFRVLDTESGQLIKKLQGHTSWISNLAFSKDGRWLASASGDHTVRLWDSTTWRPQFDSLPGHGHEVHAVAFSNDGRFLASGSKNGEVLLWDARAQRPENGRKLLPSHIHAAITLPAGQKVLGQTEGGQWSLIDLVTLDEQVLPPSEISSDRGLPNIIPANRRHPRMPPDPSRLKLPGKLSNPAFSPDRKLMAVASENGLVGLYNAKSHEQIDTLRGNMGSIFGVAFSTDNQRLALTSGGSEGIEIWDVATFQALITLSSPDALLSRVEFTGDGDTLLAWSMDRRRDSTGTCQIWRAPSWAEINSAEQKGGLWPQTEAFDPPKPPPTLAETKDLMEQVYRRKLTASRGQSSEDPVDLGESLGNLADFLHRQGRPADAEPFYLELLAHLRKETPRDDDAILASVEALVAIELTLEHAEKTAGNAAKMANHAQQADALISEQLKLLSQSSANLPKDGHLALRVAALQIWFGRDADHLATCTRLIEQAEQDSDNTLAAERAARALCIGSSSDPALYARALNLARHAAELETNKRQRGWYQQTLGLAEYRSGNDAAVEQSMIRAEESAELSSYGSEKSRRCIVGLARFFRTMALWRQGKKAEARKLYAEAEADMNPLPQDAREVLINGAKLDDLLFWLAYKEAKALLQPQAPTTQPAAAGK